MNVWEHADPTGREPADAVINVLAAESPYLCFGRHGTERYRITGPLDPSLAPFRNAHWQGCGYHFGTQLIRAEGYTGPIIEDSVAVARASRVRIEGLTFFEEVHEGGPREPLIRFHHVYLSELEDLFLWYAHAAVALQFGGAAGDTCNGIRYRNLYVEEASGAGVGLYRGDVQGVNLVVEGCGGVGLVCAGERVPGRGLAEHMALFGGRFERNAGGAAMLLDVRGVRIIGAQIYGDVSLDGNSYGCELSACTLIAGAKVRDSSTGPNWVQRNYPPPKPPHPWWQFWK